MGAFQTITRDPGAMSQTPQSATQYMPVSQADLGINPMPQGKGGAAERNITYPGSAGQPSIGMPNKYSNTMQFTDNQTINGVSRGKGI